MKRILNILTMSILLCCSALAERQYNDSAIWQGMNLKLDVGNTIYCIAQSKGATQQYEMALNANLLNKFYPTLELGYGLSQSAAAGGKHEGQGAFMKVGLDINPLRKNRNRYYALLVGIRLAFDLQQFSLSDVTLNDDYWGEMVVRQYPPQFRADCWGEILAGMQIKVAGPLTMGWYARYRFLLTENVGNHKPYYIPGFGCIDGAAFGFNYYIGWRF